MACDEGRLVAFLSGQLSDEDEHAFDEHLLTCEACWRAVGTDRASRRALDQLRVSAPPGLADRVTSSIRLAETVRVRGLHPERRHRRRRITAVVAVAAAVVLLGGVLGWVLQGRPATDPPQIARVVAMLSPRLADQPALRAGERFDFAGQTLTIRSYRVEGDIVLVATSDRPFPMPTSSHVLAGSSPAAWMAAESGVAMYGVNRTGGAKTESMFLVAAMSMAQLPQVAAKLHLI